MTVAELIEELKKFPQDLTVFVQTDEHFGYHNTINVVERKKIKSGNAIKNPDPRGWSFIHPEHDGIVLEYI